ncbi:Protein of unknown function DUF1350, partial [Dillenia turbinata]
MAICILTPQSHPRTAGFSFPCSRRSSVGTVPFRWARFPCYKYRIRCNYNDSSKNKQETTGVQLYRDIERLLTETVRQSQEAWGASTDWSEVEGAWVLKPRNSRPRFVVHFVGGIFVGAAPQLTYRLFLERLAEKSCLLFIQARGLKGYVTGEKPKPAITDSTYNQWEAENSLVMSWLINSMQPHISKGSRYAVQRSGNVLVSFNNKEASLAIPLFSPVLVPMAQSMGPLLSQIASSPTIRLGAEMTMKQLENLSPPIMKQLLPLVEQLPPLYMDLVNGRENFIPKPEETRRLIKSYYGVSRNLLIKFKDDTIDETSTLAQVLSSESAISSMIDMSIRMLPGDHGLPLQQVPYMNLHISDPQTIIEVEISQGLLNITALPDVPPAMADAVNRGSELFQNLTTGTPWETVAREVGNTIGANSRIPRAESSKDLDLLVDLGTEKLIKWSPSQSGKLKLNTDGAVSQSSGLASARGLLRDSAGGGFHMAWRRGFKQAGLREDEGKTYCPV